jgi:hypothetical protein
MKNILLFVFAVTCPSWNAHDCLDDLPWNACVTICEDRMDQCLLGRPSCGNPKQDWAATGCDICLTTEADCVLACPNPAK